MAELTVGEMLTNICWVKLTSVDHVKCSGNWMWAAKLEHEGAAMYAACESLHDVMVAVGVSIDGGKDSLSMAAQCGEEMIKTPGTLVISGYCTTDDVLSVVTPDIKLPGQSALLLVDLGQGNARLGGSVLAQVFAQLGATPPRMDDPAMFRRAIEVQQMLLGEGKLLAGHDRRLVMVVVVVVVVVVWWWWWLFSVWCVDLWCR
jgi:phosphoribosylformylglycinamidine synthase